jgi:Chain length determinant protein
MDNQQNIENTSDEITLKELVQKVREYAIEIKNNWLIVLVFIAIALVGMLYKFYTTPKEYTATLTFMVNEKEGGGGLAGAASILSSLGGGGDSKNNLDKILTLSKSMRILQEVMLSKETINGQNDYFANHIIKEYNFDNTVWKKSLTLKGFRFTKSLYSKNIDSLDTNERSVLKSVYSKIVGTPTVDGLMSNSQSRQTQIMTMNVVTTSDELSVKLCTKIFDKLGNFYVSKTIERELQTFHLVKMKADSIKRLLYGADYATAKFEDSNRGLFMEQVKVPVKQLNRSSNILTLMYGEAIKNLEVSDFAVKNSTPFVQAIDLPFSPLSSSDNSLKKTLAIAIALGFIVASLLIIVRKLLRDSL